MQVTGLEAKSYKVTPAGMKEMQAELERLRARRQEVAGEIQDITSQSNDVNAQEDSTRVVDQNQATELDGQIDLLGRVIGMAQVVEPPKDSKVVAFGSTVTISLNGQEHAYQIVGTPEADPAAGKISDESPLGHALVGRKVGDKSDSTSPTGERLEAKIISIS